jgi:hypothetical protein
MAVGAPAPPLVNPLFAGTYDDLRKIRKKKALGVDVLSECV